MKISALASGSSGNCFFIENTKNNQSVLVDAGIPSKKIEERLSDINKTPEKVKAILITHEHSDHIRGADIFSRKFNIPIFITKKTAQATSSLTTLDSTNFIRNNETLKLAGIEIQVFSKSHKAADPIFFSLTKNSKKVSVITDAGYTCENIIDAISSSNFLCLESNHDEQILAQGHYPAFLKAWIRSDIGHLSNKQAAICTLEHGKSRLKNIILSHLSENNNTPEEAMNTWNYLISQRRDLKPNITVSLRDFATPLVKV